MKKKTPQITQIISALSSWLLALSKQQARRPPLPQPESQPFYFRVPSCNFVANLLVIFIGVLYEIKTFSVSSVSSVAKLISWQQKRKQEAEHAENDVRW